MIVANRALAHVLSGADDSFSEAAHTIAFPRAQGFLADRDEQRCDVFARAIIACALHRAQDVLGVRLDELLSRERDYLLGARRTDGIGGWSYAPALAELPPDADDVAQVMLALLAADEREAIEVHAIPAASALLRDGALPNGGYRTWIVPRAPTTDAQRLQATWIREAWGDTFDAEVTANFLYALGAYNVERFADAIVSGANAVASAQEPDGSWKSSWYHGPFYGTYMCLRLIAGIAPQHPSVASGTKFLLASQRQDGSWGVGTRGDTLSTALALLGLHASRSHGVRAAVARGIAALDTAGDDYGLVPFIRMDLGRATGVPTATLTYASTTITAAFVLEAACAFFRSDLQ